MRKKSNMSLLTNHVLSGVALIAGLGLTASHAYAQHGTFNLPFEARWGSVALPLGPCRISVLKRMSLPRIIEISSNGRTVSIMAGFEALQPQSDHCYLSLLNIDGTYVVREFNSGAWGKVFTFPLPKTVHNEAAGLHKAQTTRLPIGS